MPKLSVFNSVSVDGYFSSLDGDFSWAFQQDPEWEQFTKDNAKNSGVLMFGRVTYEMMASYWTSPVGLKSQPAVAERMNDTPKLVFSKTLKKAAWNNSTLVKGDVVRAVRVLKEQ